MAKSTVSIPIPPLTRPRNWPNPQMTLPQPAPNQPSANKNSNIINVPRGGGGNP